MATLTVTGDGTQSDDGGQGGIVVVSTVFIQNILLYRTTSEEILSLSDSQYIVSEDGGSVSIVFTRRNAREARTLTFGITVQPLTATLGQNYSSPPSSGVFASGESLIVKNINIINTHMGISLSKTFKVRTTVPPNRDAYIRGPVSEALVTIAGVA